MISLLQPWFITKNLQATDLGESLPAVWAGRRNCKVLRRWTVIEDAAGSWVRFDFAERAGFNGHLHCDFQSSFPIFTLVRS